MDRETKRVIADRLAQIEQLCEGRLTPDAVVADARDETSPLHSLFEWSDERAAHQFRLDQARRLIRSVRVEVKTSTRIVSTVRYVRDPEAERAEQGYIDVVKLRTDEQRARLAVRAELERVESLLERARDVARALEREEELDALIARVAAFRESVAVAEAA